MSVLGAGCGDVVFVDPDASLRAALRIEKARVLEVTGDPRIYLRIEVPSRQGMERFRVFVYVDDARFEVPLDGAAVVRCRDAHTCVELVTGPGPLAEAGFVELVFPALDHIAVGPLERVRLGPYELDIRPIERNSKLRIAFAADPVGDLFAGEPRPGGRAPFARRFELAMAPGPCTGPFEASRWLPIELPDDVPADLDEERVGCVGLRPARPVPGPAVDTRTVVGLAEVERYTYVYRPEIEVAPLVYLPVFDLEIPNAERCRQTQEALIAAIEEVGLAIADASPSGAPVVGLRPVQVANQDGAACRQAPERGIPVVEVLTRVRSELERALPAMPRVRPLVVYASNLALAPPERLARDIDALAVGLGTLGQFAYVVGVAPEAALEGLRRDADLAWTSTLDPSFRDRLDPVLARAWPFSTLLHDDQTRVPLAGETELPGMVGWRACQHPPTVTPLGAPGRGTAFGPSPPAPAFRATLGRRVLVPPEQLSVPVVEVTWEACYALCDRPASVTTGDVSWLQQSSCAP